MIPKFTNRVSLNVYNPWVSSFEMVCVVLTYLFALSKSVISEIFYLIL